MNYLDLARIAYHNYGSVTNWLNYQGLPMPEYNKLPETIKQAWEAAVKSVVFEIADNRYYWQLLSLIDCFKRKEDKEMGAVVNPEDREEFVAIANQYNYAVVSDATNSDGTSLLTFKLIVEKEV